MKIKNVFLIFLGVLTTEGLFMSCATHHYRAELTLEEVEVKQLDAIEKLSSAGEYARALHEVDEFRTSHKESIYYQASRLVEAKTYYEMQDFNKSLEIYEDILSLGPDKYPAIWARARYESTFIFEALGDDLKAITTLVGLENSSHLLEEVKFAEAPARLAALYSRQGNDKEATAYLDRADRGLKYLLSRNDLNRDRSWLAETLYRMGKANMTPLSEKNIAQQVQSQRRLQVYLLRAIEQGVPLWSQKASEDLMLDYQKQWSFVQTHWNQIEDRPVKLERMKDLHQLISENMYRKPSDQSLWNPYLKNYYDFAIRLEAELSETLFSGKDLTPSSEESLKLNSIKKNARVKATLALPEEKKASKNIKKDPNL